VVNLLDLGTYISGDTGTDTVITIENENGVAIDLAGATAISLEAVSSKRDVLSVSAMIFGVSTAGQVIIEDLAQAFTPTADRRIAHFEGVVKWSQAGESWRSRDRVKFAIELFP
jgi:hypothetical protein